MFWDKIAGLYDLFENIYNKKVYFETGKEVANLLNENDDVLECACGTGAISRHISEKVHTLTATDFSEGMLKQARKKLHTKNNITFAQADITKLPYKDHSFDAVVAGNVIHLIKNPQNAMQELMRVCKKGGRIIIPTYINDSENTSRVAVKFLEKLGADFKRQFDAKSYAKFFEEMNISNVRFVIVDGRMPCDIAIIDM